MDNQINSLRVIIGEQIRLRRKELMITQHNLKDIAGISIIRYTKLAGLMPVNGGSNYKHKYSYEEQAELIKLYIPAWRIEIEKFF